MLDDRKSYELIIQEWHEDWALAGRPLEATAPTLKSFLAQENPHSKFRLLAGAVPNMQTSFEAVAAGLEYAPPPEDHPPQLSTLDKACGLAGTPRSEMLLARVASFASEQTRNEANSLALTSYAGPLAAQTFDHIPEPSEEKLNEYCFRVQRYLRQYIDADSELFLSRLFSCSMKSFNIKHGGNTKILMSCVLFWHEYGDWRASSSSSNTEGELGQGQ